MIVWAPWVLNVTNPLNKQIFFGLIYVLLMVWRPEGVIGGRGCVGPSGRAQRTAADESGGSAQAPARERTLALGR